MMWDVNIQSSAAKEIILIVFSTILINLRKYQRLRPQRPLGKHEWEGGLTLPPIFILRFKKKSIFFLLGGEVKFVLGGLSYPPTKQLKTFPGPIRSLTVKENHIGSAVGKILCYRQKSLLFFRLKFAEKFIFI